MTHRTRVLFVSLIVLVLVGVATALLALNPFKVTDPADPRFDVTKFKFSDYESKDELFDALSVIFPVSTKRFNVEKILINDASYWSSDIYEADIPENGFPHGRKPSSNWSGANYFIDYGLRPNECQKENNCYWVRILFNKKTNELLEIHIEKYQWGVGPLMSVKELKKR